MRLKFLVLPLILAGCEALFPGTGEPPPPAGPPTGGVSGGSGTSGGAAGAPPPVVDASPPVGGAAGSPATMSPSPSGTPDARSPAPSTATDARPSMPTAMDTRPTPEQPIPDAQPPPPPIAGCDFPHERQRLVQDPGSLRGALSTAVPGDLIRLADGNYAGAFTIDRSGAANRPIVLCGGRNAVLTANTSTDVLQVQNASHWIIAGFTIRGGLRAVMLDNARSNRLHGLLVQGTGQEGVHFRTNSSDNVLERSEIRDTGTVEAQFGEAVYIGSAYTSWARITGSANTPDRSDRNAILDNILGPGVRAEHIDIKEGTTGGRIEGNTFDGRGMVAGGFADSWVDVKGNGYTLRRNRGTTSLKDGFQVHVATSGWGNDNTFTENVAEVNGSGYGFWIQRGATGNQIDCSNRAVGAAAGLANVACVRAD